jgi:hypothetical protein
MKHMTRVLSLATTAVSLAIGCVSSLSAFAQALPGPNALYIARAALGDCPFGVGGVTMQVGVGAPPPPGMPPIPAAVNGAVQVHKLAFASAENPKTGAPYSAVGTTEMIQTLADGNRIVHTNTSHVYRDSSGRVRTEMALSAVGPFTLDASSTVITINDPVAKQMLVLHPEQKRAEVLPSGPGNHATGTSTTKQGQISGSVAAGSKADTPELSPLPVTHCTPGTSPAATTVALGQKTFEGLTATGTRVEYTIPAGQIGNEQPITVTSEQWVSEELGVMLSSTRHDPMIGDTQFHLSQIERTEPDPSLFVVPANYTVSDVSVNKAIILQRPDPPG